MDGVKMNCDQTGKIVIQKRICSYLHDWEQVIIAGLDTLYVMEILDKF